jgi:hypothetical protein
MPLSKELRRLSSSGGKGGRMAEEEDQWQFCTNRRTSLNISIPGSDIIMEEQQQACVVTPTVANLYNNSRD